MTLSDVVSAAGIALATSLLGVILPAMVRASKTLSGVERRMARSTAKQFGYEDLSADDAKALAKYQGTLAASDASLEEQRARLHVWLRQHVGPPTSESANPAEQDRKLIAAETQVESAKETPGGTWPTIIGAAGVFAVVFVGGLNFIKTEPPDCLKYGDYLVKITNELTPEQRQALVAGPDAHLNLRRWEDSCATGPDGRRTSLIVSGIPPGTAKPNGTTTTTS